jgi:phosphatidylglycerophosphate synthase
MTDQTPETSRVRGTIALVICPAGDPQTTADRKLAGLTVGERLLLALSLEGVRRIAFIGLGQRPASQRVEIELFEPTVGNGPAEGEEFLLLPADLVFERSMACPGASLPGDLPLRWMPASAWKAVLADPEGFLDLLSPGRVVDEQTFAVRVTDRRSARQATSRLMANLRKSVDGVIARYLNRPISVAVSRLLVRTGITPNQLTVAIVFPGLAAAGAAAWGEPWWMLLLAGLLLQLQSILDGCDGEIARLTYRFSRAGQWLDTVGDDLVNYCFVLGLAIGQARLLGWPWLYAVGGFVFALQWASSLIMYQRLAKLGSGDLTALPNLVTQDRPSGFSGRLLKIGRIVTKRDFFVFAIALLTAAQLPLAAFATAAIGTIPAFVGILTNELRLRRRLAAGDGEPGALPDSRGEI